MKALDKFFAMRLKSASRWPYAAEAILALIPVETVAVPRMAVDRRYRIYFNPEWLTQTAEKDFDLEILTVILHELSHPLRRHFKRFIKLVGYDPERLRREEISARHQAQSRVWNMAADCEINDDLEAEGLPISRIRGGGAVTPATYGLPVGLTAEQYFEKLWEQAEDDLQKQESQESREAEGKEDGQDGNGSSDPGESEGSQDSEGSDGSGEGDGESQAGEGGSPSSSGQGGSGSGSGGSGEGEAGTGGGSSNGQAGASESSDGDSVDWEGSSAVDGFKRAWEYGKNDGKGEDSSEDIPEGLSEAEQEHLANQVAKKIEQAVKGRGNVPAGWRRWADARLHPQVPWQRVLRNSITRSVQTVHGCKDYTFNRVSRREPTRPDLISSSPFARRIKTRVVVDTSGSMSDKDLSLALAEIEGILSSSQLRDGVQVGSCDAAMHTCQKVFKRSQVKLAGGGGTDMRVPITEVIKERMATRPDVLIIVTDGETPWPETPAKGVQVIAVLTREPSWCDPPPKWIRTIKVS